MGICALKLLWVNLCNDDGNAQKVPAANQIGTIYIVRPVDKKQIMSSVEGQLPDTICIDYDYPNGQSLQMLRQVRVDYPSIPILMLTTHHCESLAIWAFRTGVRNYLIKPIPEEAFIENLNQLTMLAKTLVRSTGPGARQNVLDPPPIPQEFRFETCSTLRMRTARAVYYMEAHVQEKITEPDMAALCGISTFEFSRVFRREHGMTFREFLMRYRIERARELLHNPAISVTTVASLVGCSDASSFARFFRRYVGMIPSRYQKETHQLNGNAKKSCLLGDKAPFTTQS